MPQAQAPDRTGEKRSLHIAQFERSDFASVIVGPSYWLTVDREERTLDNGTVIPAKSFRTERAPVVSLREALDGSTYLALTDENVDYRFMAPRAKAVVGIDADENGAKIDPQELIDMAKESFQEFLARQAAPATVTATDDLPL